MGASDIFAVWTANPNAFSAGPEQLAIVLEWVLLANDDFDMEPGSRCMSTNADISVATFKLATCLSLTVKKRIRRRLEQNANTTVEQVAERNLSPLACACIGQNFYASLDVRIVKERILSSHRIHCCINIGSSRVRRRKTAQNSQHKVV